MAISITIYGQFALNVMKKLVNMSTDSFKASLHTPAYTPNKDTHDFKDDLTNEITGTNYVAGGVALTGVTLTYDAANDRVVFDCDDVTFTNITATLIRYLVIADVTPATDATRPLVLWVDLDTGAGAAITAGDLVVQWAAGGVLRANV